jgi:hypothetical protein
MRAVRKALGGVIPAAVDTEISLNPFDHPELMQVVERNMQRMAAGEAIHVKSVNGMVPDDPSVTYPALELGEWVLLQNTDRLLVYRVQDHASGITFKVLFPIYGGLISGWDVQRL